MSILVVHLHVRDYDAWKPIFDEHEDVRRRHGARRHWIYRTPEDPNDLVIAVEFPSPSEADAFVADPSLRDAMVRAGVVGEPTVHVREHVEDRSYEQRRVPALARLVGRPPGSGQLRRTWWVARRRVDLEHSFRMRVVASAARASSGREPALRR